MAVTSVMALTGLLLMLALHFTGAQIGVCYGMNGNNLPSPAEVVDLCTQYNIDRIRIYNPDQGILQAIGGSNIEVAVGLPNNDLQKVAASQANAKTWVQTNIRNYPNVRFRYIVVGNEISPLRDTGYTSFVLPAMQNIYNATFSAGLADQIKVSTAIDTGVIVTSYPPGDGSFMSGATDYMYPIIGFLMQTGAPLLVSVYPYFSYISNKADLQLSYALFTSSDWIEIPGGIRYQNLFYAMVDATYAALEKSNGSSVEIVVSESGWPSAGEESATVENAQTYYTNLIEHVRVGTPKRLGRPIETYIHSLFDENLESPGYSIEFSVVVVFEKGIRVTGLALCSYCNPLPEYVKDQGRSTNTGTYSKPWRRATGYLEIVVAETSWPSS